MDATAEPSAGYAKGRAKRQEIIEAAMLVFGTQGYNKSSMLEIAERCDLSRAGVSHHFPSKESILQAVLAWRDDKDRERFRANGSATPDGLGVLRGMVDLARHNAKVPGLIALYTVLAAEAAAPGHPAHGYFCERYARIVDGTRRTLERVRRAGALKPGVDPAEAAVALTALMDGLQVQWLLNPGSVDMAHHLRGAIQGLLTVELFPAGSA
jgi:AcrR family transcriptional regulator